MAKPTTAAGCRRLMHAWVCAVLVLQSQASSPGAPQDWDLGSITERLEQMGQPLATDMELAMASHLARLGQTLARAQDADSELRKRFHLASANCEVLRHAYPAAVMSLEAAASASKAADAVTIRARVADLRAVQALLKEYQGESDAGHFDDALALAQRVIDEHPACAGHGYGLKIRALFAAGHSAQAMDLLRRSAKQFESTRWGEMYLTGLAVRYVVDARHDEALAAFDEVIKKYGDRRERSAIHRLKGWCYIRMGKRAEALAELAKVREAFEKEPGILREYRQMMLAKVAETEEKARALPEQ